MKEILDGISEFVKGCLGPLAGGTGEFYGWPDWIRDFIIQLIALIILFLAVRFFLWKPVTKFIAAKQEEADKAILEAESLRQENEKINEDLKQQMDEASNKIKELLANANLEGQRRKQEIINEAKEEALRQIEDAKEKIDLEVKRQQEDIKQAIIDIAFLAAEKIAEKEISKDKYLSLVENIIEGGLKDE